MDDTSVITSSDSGIPCVSCSQLFLKQTELEAHISAEHLDYFPYSCGHCGHHIPSEELAHFHAHRRAHLPLKIREFPNVAKETELRQMVQRSLAGVGTAAADYLDKSYHENSPTISYNDKSEIPETSSQNLDGLKSEEPLSADVDSRETDRNSPTGSSDSKRSGSKPKKTADQEISNQNFTWVPEPRVASPGTDKHSPSPFTTMKKKFALQAVSTVIDGKELGRTKTQSVNLNRFGFLRQKRSRDESPAVSSSSPTEKRSCRTRVLNSPVTRRSERLVQVKTEVEEESGAVSADPNLDVSLDTADGDVEITPPKKSTSKLVDSDVVEKLKRELLLPRYRGDLVDMISLKRGGSLNREKTRIRRRNKLLKRDYMSDVSDFDSDDDVKTENRELFKKRFSLRGAKQDPPIEKAVEDSGPELKEFIVSVEPHYKGESIQVEKSTEDESPAESPLKECSLCHTMVLEKDRLSHARNHRPMQSKAHFQCTYCGFNGKSAGSVRVHIGHRHTGADTKIGIKFVQGETVEAVQNICFGENLEPMEVMENVSKNVNRRSMTKKNIKTNSGQTEDDSEKDSDPVEKKIDHCEVESGPVENKDDQPKVPTGKKQRKKVVTQAFATKRSWRAKKNVERYMATEPQFACHHCDYQGATMASVRVHIVRMHKGSDLATGIIRIRIGDQKETVANDSPSNSQFLDSENKPDKKNITSSESDSTVLNRSVNSCGISDDVITCNICFAPINSCNLKAHVNQHMMTRPLAGCAYCNFTGRTSAAVRVHLTWKHQNRSKGAGVRDLTERGANFTSMHELCFGKKEQEVTFQDPALVSKHMKICRPYARRATKSLGARPAVSTPQEEELSLDAVKNDSTAELMDMSSSSHCDKKYLHCQVCSQSVQESLISGHIYIWHIKRKSTIQCGYCDYGSTYIKKHVTKHLIAKHPLEPAKIIDNRPQMQSEYFQWRKKCFPGVRGIKKKLNSSLAKDNDCEKVETSNMEEASPTSVNDEQKSTVKLEKKEVSVKSEYQLKHASKKKVCGECGMEIYEMWLIRHAWKHLEMEGKPKLECIVPDCGFKTYLLKTLDYHCTQVHKSAHGTLNFGYADNEKKLKTDFEAMMVRCYEQSEAKKNESGSGVMGDIASNASSVGENSDIGNAFSFLLATTSGENKGIYIDDMIFTDRNSSLKISAIDTQIFTRATNVKQMSLQQKFALVKYAINSLSQVSPSARSNISPGSVTAGSSDRNSPNSHIETVKYLVSPSVDDAWCNICCCTVNKDEVENHVWYAHLAGILPYRCRRCQNSFLTKDQFLNHWENSHVTNGKMNLSSESLPSSSSSTQEESPEFDEYPNAQTKFHQVISKCFPELVQVVS